MLKELLSTSIFLFFILKKLKMRPFIFVLVVNFLNINLNCLLLPIHRFSGDRLSGIGIGTRYICLFIFQFFY